MKHLLYGLTYLYNYQILQKNTPLICGLTITNKCNLKCRHCRVFDRGMKHANFGELITVMDSFYREGGRTLYIQGGEPFVWHDGAYGLEDIVDYARRIGFLTTIVYTNGTLPLKTSADTVFISMDGLEKTHDDLRGKTFQRIIKNIHESTNPDLYINFTINNHNKNERKDRY